MGLNYRELSHRYWEEMARQALRAAAPEHPELRGEAMKKWHGGEPGVDRHVLCNATSGEIVNAR